MAAGPLRNRIRTILKLEDDPMLISGKSLGVVMSGLLLAATLVVLSLPARGQADESEMNSHSVKDTDSETTTANAAPAALEAETQNNLKKLILSLQVYCDSKGSFPPYANFDANGKPLLSWRVLMLPYLDSAHLESSEAKLLRKVSSRRALG